ncbi:MAG: hypothetical protein AB7P00_09315 [Sandaracinaceae bacterium]
MWRLVLTLGGASALLLSACDDGDPGTDAGSRRDGGGSDTDAGPPGDGGTTTGSCSDEANVQFVTGEISSDTTWSCPNLYVLQGAVFVTNGAVLTIDAGVEVLGDTSGANAASLIVTRGSRIEANGTAAAPIVFSSGANIGSRASGDWAGVALLGSATTNTGNDCSIPGACMAGTGDFFEKNIEGIPVTDVRGFYGGDDDSSSCGTLRYVRIEFAGRELSPNNELNGLTLGACGSGTTISHVQVHRGKDDAIELFGGTANLDHIVLTGASDDSLDFDEGWRGNAQFVVIHQYPSLGDRGIESDNLGSNEAAEPRTEANLWNFTMIGTSDNKWALHREGMLGIMGNFVVTGYGAPVDVNANTEDPNNYWPARFVYQNGVFNMNGAFPPEDLDDAGVCTEAMSSWTGSPAWVDASCDDLSSQPDQQSHYDDVASDRRDDDFGFDESALLMAAERNNTFDVDPMFSSVSPASPSFVPGNASLPAGGTPVFNANAPSGFGDTSATYVGAIDPAGDDWTEGWTAYPTN